VASTFMNNSIAEILILVLVMLVLVLRPSGLLGRAEA